MAVYAAYRHIELDNIGYGKKRVLKPPGGGSSDIFGSDAELPRVRNTNHLQSSVFGNMMETTATKSKLTVSAKNPNAALFGNENVGPDQLGDHKNDALGHSFFDAEEVTADADKDKLTVEEVESDLAKVDEADKPIEVQSVLETNEARDARRNPINHNGMTAADCTQSCNQRSRTYQQKPVGNPVTGEGYAIANGVKEMAAAPVAAAPAPSRMTNGSAPKTNGSAPVAPAAPASTPNRGRVPPGGYSSGLW